MISRLKNWYINNFHFEQTDEYKQAQAYHLDFEKEKIKKLADAMREMYTNVNAELRTDVEKMEASFLKLREIKEKREVKK